MLPLDRLQPQRIALIKPSALGDIVHALPVLTALRCRFPEASITWIVNKAYEPLLIGHPDLTATLPFDRGAIRKGTRAALSASAAFLAKLASQRFDLTIDLQGLMRTGLMSLATAAPRRVALAPAREGSRFAYTELIHVRDNNETHAVDRYWRAAEAFGAGDFAKQFRVPLQPGAEEWVRNTLQTLPRPWVAVAVGARWVTKRWPASHYAELGRRTQSAFGGSWIFVGTGEDTADASKVIAQMNGPTRDLTGRTTLPQLAATLAACDVMIGNDTGPLHLAAALGRPCIAPYTCTQVKRHGPYGSMSGGVETNVACRGSYLKTCDKLICMPELTPDRLWPRVERCFVDRGPEP
jgi:heptosyltransferase I